MALCFKINIIHFDARMFCVFWQTIGAAYGAKKVEVHGRTVVLGVWVGIVKIICYLLLRIYFVSILQKSKVTEQSRFCWWAFCEIVSLIQASSMPDCSYSIESSVWVTILVDAFDVTRSAAQLSGHEAAKMLWLASNNCVNAGVNLIKIYQIHNWMLSRWLCRCNQAMSLCPWILFLF